MENLSLYIESLIFASRSAISVKEISDTLKVYLDVSISKKEIEESLDLLTQKYKDDNYAFEIVEIADGYQFMTKGLYHPIVGEFLKLESKKKLSRAALETMSGRSSPPTRRTEVRGSTTSR